MAGFVVEGLCLHPGGGNGPFWKGLPESLATGEFGVTFLTF